MTNQKKGQKVAGTRLLSIGLVLVIVIAVNVIASKLFFRLDITEEKLYTLSAGSQKIVAAYQVPAVIKYYFSKSSKQIPLSYKSYGNKVEELLREYQSLNPEMLTFESYDPKPDSDEEEWAKKYGLQAINLGMETFTMGLVILQEDKELNIPFFDIRREQFLEYDITQLLLQSSREKENTIGVMSSLPVMGEQVNQMQQMQGQRGRPKWFFIQELEKSFEVQPIKVDAEEISDDISILLLVHPKNLGESTQYAIDQFVMRGGELVILVDPNTRVDESAALLARMGQPAQSSSDLEKLFPHWGIKYKKGALLGDRKRGTEVNSQQGVLPFYLWHSLPPAAFNQNLIATKGLETMLLVEPGAFTMDGRSPLKLNPLIQSSDQAGMVENVMLRFSSPSELNKTIKPDGITYTMAGILTGELTSAFEKRPTSKKENEDKKESPIFKPHLSKTKNQAKILLITDVDFLADQFSVDQFQLLGEVISQPKNDNLIFFTNMVEFLGGSDVMMEIRSRGRFSRPFTRFHELALVAQERFQIAEESLSVKLQEVQEKLSELNFQQGTNQVILSKEQLDKIQQFRDKEKKTQSELRNIRKLLRQDIEAEKTLLTLLNLLVVPILLIIFGVILYFKRFQRRNS